MVPLQRINSNKATMRILLLAFFVVCFSYAPSAFSRTHFEQSSYSFKESDGRVKLNINADVSSVDQKFHFRITNGSSNYPATYKTDFKPIDGDDNIYVPAGSSSASVSFDIVDDNIDEEDEDFYIQLWTGYVGESGAKLQQTTSVTIVDNDTTSLGTIQAENTTLNVDEGKSVQVGFKRVNGSDGSLKASYYVVGGSAKVNDDYKDTKGSVSWGDGDSSTQYVTVVTNSDTNYTEGDETFSVVLNYKDAAGNTPETVVTIKNISPDYGRVRVKNKSLTVKENNNASVVVERLDGSDGSVSVKYSMGTSTDSAESGKDYTASSGTLNWDAGDSSSKTISIPVLKDLAKENNETFTVQLYSVAGGATLDSQNAASVTIQDATAFGSLQFTKSAANFSESSGKITVDVSRTGGSDGAVSADYTIGNSSDSAKANQDYKASNGTLSWANGDSSTKKISIELLADSVQEDDETISLNLHSVDGNATLGNTSSMKVTLSDDTSFGNIAFVSSTASVSEDDGSLKITVVRKGGNDGATSVRVRTGSTGDTATAGADYTALDSVLSWANGESGEKSVELKVLEDDVVDEDESLTLSLNEITGGALLTSPTTMTVEIKNTTLPSFGGIGFESASSVVNEVSGKTPFNVQRTGGSDGVITVQYTIGLAGDTAEEDSDYSTAQRSGELRWEDKDSAPKPIDITFLGDNIADGEKTLTIELQDVTGGAVLSANAQHSVTIQDSTTPGDVSIVLGILSGDNQSGFPGTVLQPFVLSVTDEERPLADVNVVWTVKPADAGRLIAGTTTTASSNAESSNTLEILKGGVIEITASAGSVDNASTRKLSSRADEPGTVTFTVNAGFEGIANLNDNQRAVGKTLDTACPALQAANALTPEQQDLLNTCNALENASAEDAKSGLARLTPEELFAIGTSSLDTSDIQVTNVQSRINAIRLGSNGLDLASLQIDLLGQEIPGYVTNAIGQEILGGGGSAGIGDESRLGVFVNGSIAFGTLDETDNEMGLDFDTQGLTLGLDYRTDDDWVFGGALGLTSHSGSYSSEGGKLELSGTSLSAFATWYNGDDAYFDAIMSFGKNAFTVKRRINLDGQDDQFASSKPNANELSLSIGSGLDYRSGSWQYGPYGRLGFTQSSVGSYTESASNPDGAGAGSVLAVEKQTLTSSLLVVGGQVSNTISTSGGVWIPQVKLELEHRLDDSNRKIDAAFVHDPTSTAFEIQSEDIDTDYLNFGTGVSAVFTNGKSGYLFYETRLGQDRLSQHWVKLGFRVQF